MSRNSSGERSEGFLAGKGFYIVLFLCAAVIGVSALMIVKGNETLKSKAGESSLEMSEKRVERIIVPAVTDAPKTEVLAPQEESTPVQAEETPVTVPAAAPIYVWPVLGEVERDFNITALSYDTTLRDWRTHCGADIAAGLGEPVCAIRAGSVESVVKDDMLGTVITLDHGDGVKSVYANLDETVAVSVGSWVECGSVIGSVGQTALAEIGQQPHLHLAVKVNGQYSDPIDYLP